MELGKSMTCENDVTTATSKTQSPEILLPNKDTLSPLNNNDLTNIPHHHNHKHYQNNNNKKNDIKPTTVSPPLSPVDQDGGGKGSPKQKDQIANAVNSVLNGKFFYFHEFMNQQEKK